MIQKHSFILWAKPIQEDFEITVNKVYQLLLALRDFGPELSPKYKTVRRKKDARPFIISREALAEIIKKKIDSSDMKDLGCHFGFFSSLNDNAAAGIGLSVGICYPKFNNCFSVNLPLSLPIYESAEVDEKLIETFKQCIIIFDPFWACISNHVNTSRYSGYFQDELPTTLHWVNYLDKDIVEKIGEEKLKAAPVGLVKKFNEGYFIKLKEMPIDDKATEDIVLQQRANQYFQL